MVIILYYPPISVKRKHRKQYMVVKNIIKYSIILLYN